MCTCNYLSRQMLTYNCAGRWNCFGVAYKCTGKHMTYVIHLPLYLIFQYFLLDLYLYTKPLQP